MMRVAVMSGGPSAERGIALKSAGLVMKSLDRTKYDPRLILIEENGWIDQISGQSLDLNSFTLNDSPFDFAFLVVHGTPVEDGKLQGYFESRNIPHNTCDTLTCALTFNKQWCKDFLAYHDVPMAKSQLVFANDLQAFDDSALDYPVFVKPNKNGSSYGISKVTSSEGLSAALELAAHYDDEIMVEEYLDGREFSCGVTRKQGVTHIFPLTELISQNEFFDYEAKYEGASDEITPADLPPELSNDCQQLSGRLYTLLNCRGMVRFDYILTGSTFKLLEVNTVPGLSEASIIPQQAQAYGWSVSELLDNVITDAMST